MNSPVAPTLVRLADAYRAQLVHYARVRELAREGLEAVRGGAPLSELHRLNLAKRQELARVEQIDRSVAPEKAHWRDGGRFEPGAHELDRLMAQLTDTIEEILGLERQCDRAILGEGLAGEVAAS